MNLNFSDGSKIFPDAENPNRHYLELPDGYRLIFEGDEYVGRYNPNLAEVI